MTHRSDVAVIGAGYAGLTAALRLWKKGARHGIRVTLIAPNDRFVEQIRMQDAAVGATLPDLPLAGILAGTGIVHLRSRVVAIRRDDRPELTLEDGTRRAFDRVLLTAGWDFGPGAKALDGEFWPVPHPTQGVSACDARLRALPAGSGVAIVGGGTTGVELAGAVAARRPDLSVTLIAAGRAGTFKGDRIARMIRDRLRGKGVRILDGTRAEVLGRDDGGRISLSGADRGFDAVIHASGGTAPALLRGLDLPCDATGALLVDAALRCLGTAAIHAAGDCIALTEPAGAPFRRAAYTALVTGAHAADNILRAHRGRPQRPLGFAWYGQGISLGGRDGVGFTAFPNDRPVGPVFTGAVAWHMRNGFVAGLRHLVLAQKRAPWLLWWMPGHGRRNRRRALPAPEGGAT